MKHEWVKGWRHGPGDMSERTIRTCSNCGAEQEREAVHEWGRVVGYRWHPPVGRCGAGVYAKIGTGPQERIVVAYPKAFHLGMLGNNVRVRWKRAVAGEPWRIGIFRGFTADGIMLEEWECGNEKIGGEYLLALPEWRARGVRV